MKSRFATILGIIAIVFAVSFAQAANKEVKIKTNADCANCKAAIEKALKATDGVTDATVDMKTKTANVKYDDAKTNPTKIRKAIVAAGYNADKMKAKAKNAGCSDEKCKDKKSCNDGKADAKADCKDAKAGAKCSKSCKDKKSCEKPAEVK